MMRPDWRKGGASGPGRSNKTDKCALHGGGSCPSSTGQVGTARPSNLHVVIRGVLWWSPVWSVPPQRAAADLCGPARQGDHLAAVGKGETDGPGGAGVMLEKHVGAFAQFRGGLVSPPGRLPESWNDLDGLDWSSRNARPQRQHECGLATAVSLRSVD